MSTGLYDAAADDWVRTSTAHRWTVEFTTADDELIPLDVLDCEVTFDENWAPYVQGLITAAVPDDQDTLDQLDPRLKVRATISAGYRRPDGTEDVHQLAIAYLTNRKVNRPEDTITLSVQGAEYLYDGWRALDDADWIIDLNATVWDAGDAARDAVTRCLLVCGAIEGSDIPSWDYTDDRWDYDNALTTTGWADSGDPWAPGVTDPALDFARDIAERVGGWFRCDETETWRLTGRPAIASDSVHQLKVGANGTILRASTGLSRDDWANAVLVRYTWSAGTSSGWAITETGPYAVDAVGQATTFTDLPWKGSTAAAGRRAESTLRRTLSRGRTLTLDAVAAYWLRGGSTVTVQLPLGPQERHLVSAVTYRLHEGAMSVTTRLPDNSSTITIGG